MQVAEGKGDKGLGDKIRQNRTRKDVDFSFISWHEKVTCVIICEGEMDAGGVVLIRSSPADVSTPE